MAKLRGRSASLGAVLAVTTLATPALAQGPSPDVAEPSALPADATATTPSGETAAELVVLVPESIAGIALTSSTFEAAGVLANVESDALLQEMADLAMAHDTELNRFAMAGGGGVDEAAFVSVIGGRLPGVPAEELQDAFVRLVLGPTDPELTEATAIGGHAVTVIRADADAGPENTAYVLPVGEVAWLVIADAANLEATIEALAGP